jgi:hypothetical protein
MVARRCVLLAAYLRAGLESWHRRSVNSMSRTLSAIERLDLAARAQSNALLISRARITVTFFTICLAIASTAPFRETLLVGLLAAVSAVATVILWLEWRYKIYALVMLCFMFLLGDLLSHDHPSSHTALGWIAAHSSVLLSAISVTAFGLSPVAMP